jgi:hypothetical protein
MPSFPGPSRLSVMFEDDHAVANAGLALVGLLSERLGLEGRCAEMLDIAPFPAKAGGDSRERSWRRNPVSGQPHSTSDDTRTQPGSDASGSPEVA